MFTHTHIHAHTHTHSHTHIHTHIQTHTYTHLDCLDHGGIIITVLPHDVACCNAIGAQAMQDGSGEPYNYETRVPKLNIHVQYTYEASLE